MTTQGDIETLEIQENEVFFQKVEIQVPRIFVRISRGFSNFLDYFTYWNPFGEDKEILELRKAIIIWKLTLYAWYFFDDIYLRIWEQLFGTLHPDRYLQYDDLLNNLVSNSYTQLDATQNNANSEQNYYATVKNDPKVFNHKALKKMVEFQKASAKLFGFHQESIAALEDGFDINPINYIALNIIIAEIIWIIIIPYVLRWSIVPIVHRIFSERSRTN